jgi:hypothetical protein
VGRRRRAEQNFVDPDDANRYVDLDDIEDADAAAGRQAGRQEEAAPVQVEEPKLPGKVLENGRKAADKESGSNIDVPPVRRRWSLEGLKQFASK